MGFKDKQKLASPPRGTKVDCGSDVYVIAICFEIHFRNGETSKIIFFPFPHLSGSAPVMVMKE